MVNKMINKQRVARQLFLFVLIFAAQAAFCSEGESADGASASGARKRIKLDKQAVTTPSLTEFLLQRRLGLMTLEHFMPPIAAYKMHFDREMAYNEDFRDVFVNLQVQARYIMAGKSGGQAGLSLPISDLRAFEDFTRSPDVFTSNAFIGGVYAQSFTQERKTLAEVILLGNIEHSGWENDEVKRVIFLRSSAALLQSNLFKIDDTIFLDAWNGFAVGQTPLTAAVGNSCLEHVKLFLDNGADPNRATKDYYNTSPLLKLIGFLGSCRGSMVHYNRSKDIEILKLLLQAGARAESKKIENLLRSIDRDIKTAHHDYENAEDADEAIRRLRAIRDALKDKSTI